MPAISMFYGFIVYIYFRDNKQYKKPYIHVKYQEYEAIVPILDDKILEGSLLVRNQPLWTESPWFGGLKSSSVDKPRTESEGT